ncbi:hypothetical protein GCM10020221_05510 [Streptomyces thioluteus]|uniref:Uncharacterized protein n=1 Tax=Streptomyces thioluteus TaxID=66431 RepID=A0ABN3WEN2_STRTU
MAITLQERLARTVDAARGTDADGPQPGPTPDELLKRWSEPQRRYQTVTP